VAAFGPCGFGNWRIGTGEFGKQNAVNDERSFKRLRGWGLNNVYQTLPGINKSRFTHAPLPLKKEIRLLAASAPWTKAQFESKGINALLQAAKQEPRLHIIFLWRGVLYNEMTQKVRQFGLEDRVQVINRLVDVNAMLASVHAAVNLAAREGIVKAYPHSLLDALAAGKPVLVSRAIPMADYVENAECGVIIESVNAKGILSAIEILAKEYGNLQERARLSGKHNFSIEKMLASYRQLYATVLATVGKM